MNSNATLKPLTVQQILSFIKRLGPEEQEQLLSELKDLSWARSANNLFRLDFEVDAEEVLSKLAPANLIDNLSKSPPGQQTAKMWQRRIEILTQLQDPNRDCSVESDLDNQLEQDYLRKQDALVRLAQSVIDLIAKEEQIESEITQSREFAEIWRSRAKMALQQNNEELARQSLERRHQYLRAGETLIEQLRETKASISQHRKSIFEMESVVHEANLRKHVELAKGKAQVAEQAVQEILREPEDEEKPEYDIKSQELIAGLKNRISELEELVARYEAQNE